MDVAIVRYNAGNIQSLSFALNRLGIEPTVTDDPEKLRSADKVIFPGQGEASSAMHYLRNAGLDKVIVNLKQPFLGVCLGMQLMCEYSEENNTTGLGIIPASVKKFSGAQKIPHMGWNTLENPSGSLLKDIKTGEYLYFVHSFYVEKNKYTTSDSTYGEHFSVTLQKGNFYAIQPHPEKSAATGLKILSNFLAI